MFMQVLLRFFVPIVPKSVYEDPLFAQLYTIGITPLKPLSFVEYQSKQTELEVRTDC